MNIDSLMPRYSRLLEDATIDFCDRTSVIVGVNGSVKSTVLDAM